MNAIDRQELKSRLLQEGYVEANGIESTIDRLLSLEGHANEMLNAWVLEGKVPEFEAIEGIDSRVLREKLGMKEPAVIISYWMLEKDPKLNGIQLKKLLAKHEHFVVDK